MSKIKFSSGVIHAYGQPTGYNTLILFTKSMKEVYKATITDKQANHLLDKYSAINRSRTIVEGSRIDSY